MLHCHMLDHEDDGMMAQFAVVKPHSKKLPQGLLPDLQLDRPSSQRDAGVDDDVAADRDGRRCAILDAGRGS